MKIAKIYLSLIISCFLASVCLAQNEPDTDVPPTPPGMSAKQLEKWKKNQEKATEKSEAKSRNQKKKYPYLVEGSNNSNEDSSNFVVTGVLPESKVYQKSDFVTGITPEKVALFFDDYVGKAIKFPVWLGTIEATEDAGGKVYSITVKTEDGKYFLPGVFRKPIHSLNFVLSNDLARKTVEAQEEFSNNRDGYGNSKVLRGAYIYTEIKQAGDYNVAFVLCIEFAGSESKYGVVTDTIVKRVGCQ
jgi:hypothetical protein